MKYVYLENSVVKEIIDEYNEHFPNVPIGQRYSADFLSKCVVVEDDNIPPINYLYENGTFVEPTPIVVEPIVEPTKEEQVAQLQRQFVELQEKMNTLLATL